MGPAALDVQHTAEMAEADCNGRWILRGLHRMLKGSPSP